MRDDAFNVAAEAAREGKLGMDKFARVAADRWRRWASMFTRRYRLPAWITRDDLEQEMAMAACFYWDKYDPGRAAATPSFGRYIEWNAVKRTAKSMHKARGVEQHRRKGPSRFESPMSAFSDEAAAMMEPSVASDQHQALEVATTFAELAARVGRRAPVVRALEQTGGEVEAASLAVYADPRLRLAFRLSCQGDASALVRGTIVELARGHEEARDEH